MMNKETITAALVDKVLALDYAALPPAAIDMAKAVTLDGLAVMLAGADEPRQVPIGFNCSRHMRTLARNDPQLMTVAKACRSISSAG